ncbi:MAG: hypothetical protein GF308_09450 [Candidatus Heimdallarchaeota archaeon]|nr:hypothetical protein [Candidatus Heimdallarchaeota archaeon]
MTEQQPRKNNQSSGANGSPPKKIVTIRGVDERLYNRFVLLTKARGKNTGVVFSNMISHFRKKGLLSIYQLPLLKCTDEEKQEAHLEIIKDLSELKISRKDLEVKDACVKFHFRNIDQLIFTDEVNTTILREHIYQITDCPNVSMPKGIPKLFVLSLIRNTPQLSSESRKLKDITIRNVQTDAYAEFVAYCQVKNKLIGEAVNELLEQIIPEMEVNHILLGELKENPLGVLTISTHEQVHVTNQDLQAIEKDKILFHRIEELTFAEDIPVDNFLEIIVGIYNCSSVALPSSLPRLISVSRVKDYP